MKKLIASLLLAAFALTLFGAAACAENVDLSRISDSDLRRLYELVREEVLARGLPLSQEITLRDGRYVVGEEIPAGTYTLKCLSTSGDSYGNMYSALGEAYDSLGEEDEWSGLFGSLGGLMGDMLNTQVQIIGDYGTVLKSFELDTGESVRLTLAENTALKITDGVCVLIAD